ncbi:hypothetical protein QJS10_CPB19g00578 [Acorus calamus]|uniref:TFIIB-type domain-containing protein n=1 Tax=Acorus calamus TaxID=4465 RepID=A0AAV9CFS5_ACOCL|nr:hypothetical protein QJS10_CPB19g00578 [Acorus calamus]
MAISGPSCFNCGDPDIAVDPDSGHRVCAACGTEQETSSAIDLRHDAYTVDGRQTGTFVRLGSGSGGHSEYRALKRYKAETLIDRLSSKLGLSAATAADVQRMVEEVTSGELGSGDWFPVLVAACATAVARRRGLPLSLTDAAVAASAAGGAGEVGWMMNRVSRHLDLELPRFDAVGSIDRTVRTSPTLAKANDQTKEAVIRQGRFLMQCCEKWCLSTGRRPLPLVAAVASFAAEINGCNAPVAGIARELGAAPATAAKRWKELVGTLIKAAKSLLPWGNDVNPRNIVHHAPLILKCMEMKSKSKSRGEAVGYEFDLKAVTSNGEDLKYFSLDGEDSRMSPVEILSNESLSEVYRRAMVVKTEAGFAREGHERKRKRGGELVFDEWFWPSERLGCVKRGLSLEEVVERDVGYDAMPPAFVAGLEARKRRREKIVNAKSRIDGVTNGGERVMEGDIDWEDCLIELLLLHNVDEEMLEEGQYNRLLDLHVFDSVSA